MVRTVGGNPNARPGEPRSDGPQKRAEGELRQEHVNVGKADSRRASNAAEPMTRKRRRSVLILEEGGNVQEVLSRLTWKVSGDDTWPP